MTLFLAALLPLSAAAQPSFESRAIVHVQQRGIGAWVLIPDVAHEQGRALLLVAGPAWKTEHGWVETLGGAFRTPAGKWQPMANVRVFQQPTRRLKLLTDVEWLWRGGGFYSWSAALTPAQIGGFKFDFGVDAEIVRPLSSPFLINAGPHLSWKVPRSPLSLGLSYELRDEGRRDGFRLYTVVQW